MTLVLTRLRLGRIARLRRRPQLEQRIHEDRHEEIGDQPGDRPFPAETDEGLEVHRVVVPPAVPLPLDNSGLSQVLKGGVGGPLSDTNSKRYLANRRAGMLGDVNQSQRVRIEETPTSHGLLRPR